MRRSDAFLTRPQAACTGFDAGTTKARKPFLSRVYPNAIIAARSIGFYLRAPGAGHAPQR